MYDCCYQNNDLFVYMGIILFDLLSFDLCHKKHKICMSDFILLHHNHEMHDNETNVAL